MGETLWDLLIEEDHASSMNEIMEKLCLGRSWSGQFPFKKRSGELFMAMVTKSPLYEDGELVGVITVSSDAAVFNSIKLNQSREYRFNRRRIQWQSRPQIASVPPIASSISDLALRVLSRQREDDIPRDGEDSFLDAGDTNSYTQGRDIANGQIEANSCQEDSVISRPRKIAAKLFARLQIKRTSGNAEVTKPHSPRVPKQTTFDNSTISIRSSPFQGVLLDDEDIDATLENRQEKEVENSAGHKARGRNFQSSGESCATSSFRGDNESKSVVNFDIHWEDLRLGEAIGQGSYAVVYHGLWNGSDVAIKVYLEKDYDEGTLLDYKKEIGIMRKLRHPNVLLFMGACYSHERLAIVTEFLPRGSLFKILHKSNKQLDIRRRLRMALDVARGMNYLHRRNPPIVHMDLKSSNLLVDKNWNVKVGDFGLSKLKHATFLTAKSGGGTPQWMAPEVLRNERSNEKSDVFSFGVILWELMTISIPWANLNTLQVVGVVGFMERRLDIAEGLDPRISSVISDSWQSKPELRPSFENIIQRMTGIIQSVSAGAARPFRRSLAYN